MFCPQCCCEFSGWSGSCPQCKSRLVDELLPDSSEASITVTYDELVDLVKENSGQVSIDLTAAGVEVKRKWRFPYLGYGYAWSKRLIGVFEGVLAELTTLEKGHSSGWSFPYRGYGFAWIKSMAGTIGGNQVELVAVKIGREKKWSFPFFGYGRAWTEKLEGECGDSLRVDLVTTQVARKKSQRFPYLGYGYAWENKAVLTMALKE